MKQAPASKRRAFRNRLSDELAKLIDDPRPDLDWHHAVGRLTARLRPGRDQQATFPGGWLAQLSEALGPGPSLFQKSARFAAEYPGEKDLRGLRRYKVDWSRLVLSFPVRRKKERHALLREAIQGKWTFPQLRFAVQDRSGSARPGAGGRTPRDPARYGAEACVRELGRLAGRWLRFHEHAWSKVGKAQWRKLLRAPAGPGRERLLELLRDAEEAVTGVAAAVEEARQKLSDLRQRAGGA
jgi:hypothetical protein